MKDLNKLSIYLNIRRFYIYLTEPSLDALLLLRTFTDILVNVLVNARIFFSVTSFNYSDLEEALLLLPFSTACEIVRMLPSLLERGSNTEMLCRLAVFLLKVHHAPLTAHKALLKPLIQIQAKAGVRLAEIRVSAPFMVIA